MALLQYIICSCSRNYTLRHFQHALSSAKENLFKWGHKATSPQLHEMHTVVVQLEGFKTGGEEAAYSLHTVYLLGAEERGCLLKTHLSLSAVTLGSEGRLPSPCLPLS